MADLSGKLELADVERTAVDLKVELSVMLLLAIRFWQSQMICLSQDFLSVAFHYDLLAMQAASSLFVTTVTRMVL